MRRTDKEITDQDLIDEILKKSEICRVAFSNDEFPYIVPFNYGYRDNALYFHSAGSGKKIDLIRKNNKVCFEITQSSRIVKGKKACNWTTKYRSVIGFGSIEIITETSRKVRGLDIIMEHYGQKNTGRYDTHHLERLVILKLTIEQLSAKQSGDWPYN